MRRPQGYGFLRDRFTGEIVKERDTFTCSHCSRIVPVPPFTDPVNLGGHCKACDSLICPTCANRMARGAVCITWVKRIDLLDDKLRFVENERDRIKLYEKI